MYSAPIIAKAKLFVVLFNVEQIITPPGFRRSPQILRKASGSGTCSITSRLKTASNFSSSSQEFFRGDVSVVDLKVHLLRVLQGDSDIRSSRVDAGYGCP